MTVEAPAPTAVDTRFEYHIDTTPEDSSAGMTAIELLKKKTGKETGLSTQVLKKAMSNGAVWLESSHGIHRLRRAKKVLASGDKLHLYYDKDIQQSHPAEAELIADEGDYSIWNKPYGMYSQGSKWGDHCTIYRWAEQHLKPQRQAFVVHRLDRAASGLILLAHSKKMAATFSSMFEQRQIKKQYQAKVAGELSAITLPHTISSDIDGKPAVTHLLDQTGNEDGSYTLVIEIETGRKHQIRKHLAETGHPIIGDRLYGKPPFDTDLQLQACLLEFVCPLSNKKKTYQLTS